MSLPLPEQEVVHARRRVGAEAARRPRDRAWNAQISLLTGRAAARLMLDGGVGLLRTMPPAPAEAVGRLRLAARALGVAWPGTPPTVTSSARSTRPCPGTRRSCTTRRR